MSVHDHSAVVVDALYDGLSRAFPLKGRRMGKHYLTEETAGVHHRTAVLRHALRWRLVAYRSAVLRCAFVAWADKKPFVAIFSGRWVHQLRLSIALSSMRLSTLGKEVRRLCRRDRAAFFSALAEEADAAPPGQVHTAIKKVLRPKKFRRGGPQPLPRLKRPDGSLCTTADEVTDEWRRHFASLEGGACVSAPDLVAVCTQRQRKQGALEVVPASEVPSFCDLVASLRGMRPHRAAGPDLLPPSLCARFALPVARLLWPILLKSMMFATEGIGLKGGTLHHIAKASSPNSSFAADQRGILLQPVFSKAIHKTLRRLPAALFERRAAPLQIGGRKGLSFELGHFMSRNFLLQAKHAGLSAALVFTDLAAAYYAVVREAIVGARHSPDPIEAVTASLNLTTDTLQELQHYITSEPVLDGDDCTPFLRALMQEAHCDTWFHVARDSQIIRTTRGTRPGSCIADVAFSLLFERVLARRGAFSGAMTPTVYWSGQRRPEPYSRAEHGTRHAVVVRDIVYADDHAACVVSPDAAGLTAAVAHVTGRSLDAIRGHGLTANIGPRKTAALLVHRGRGAKAARDALFSRSKGKITVLQENAQPVQLDAVPTYRHLGSVISYNGSLVADVRARVLRAKAEFGEGRRRVFCCPQIHLARRVVLFRQHILSAVLAGAGAWPTLCAGAWQTFEQGLTSMHRQLLRLRGEAAQHCTRDAVFVACDASDPSDLLCLERLRFLCRLFRTGPNEAWALLQNSPDALSALHDACAWLHRALSCTSPLGCFRLSWDSWAAAMSSSPRYWKGLLKRAASWHNGCRAMRVHWSKFVRSAWPTRPAAVEDHSGFQHGCLLCKRAFALSQSWASHAALKHGYRTPQYRFARGNRCRACGSVFSSVGRLRNHLGSSRICLQAVEDELPSLLPVLDCQSGHVQARAVAGRGTAHLPAVRPEVVGPLLAQLRALTSGDDESIFELISTFVAPFPVLRQTLEAWISELPAGALREAAEDVLLCFRVELLCEHAEKPGDNRHAVLDPLIVPLVWQPRPAGLAGLLCGASVAAGEAALDIAPHGGWRCFDFYHLPPSGLSFAGAFILIPPPPVASSPLWEPPSCTLRALARQTLSPFLLFPRSPRRGSARLVAGMLQRRGGRSGPFTPASPLHSLL